MAQASKAVEPRAGRRPSLPPQPRDAAAFARESVELAQRPSLLKPRPAIDRLAVARVVSVGALALTLTAAVVELFMPFGPLAELAAASCALAVVVELLARLARAPWRLRAAGRWQDTALLAVVTAGLALAARLTGGTESPLLVLPLAVVALSGAVLPPRGAATVAGFAALLCAGLFLGQEARWPQALGVASTALGLGAVASLALRAAALRFRDQAAIESEGRLQRLLEDARAYRLSGARDDEDAARKRALAAAMAVRESLSRVVEVVARALHPHSVLLLWLDDAGEQLSLRELRSASDHVVHDPIPARRGVLGSVVTSGAPVSLQHLKPDYDGVTYYDPPQHPACFLGVPLFEGEHLRGVLAVDRLEDLPFTPADEALLSSLAREVVRATEVERLFAVMDHDRRTQEELLRLTEALNQSLTLDAALDALVEGLLAVSGAELAAVVLVEEAGPTVVRARGLDAADTLQGLALGDEGSLVASAIRAQASLPARAELSGGKTRSRLFGGDLDPSGLRRAKVVPLLHQEEAIGAIVVASRRSGALGEEVVRLLHVAAGHGAIALVNGRLYARMERMATRDGLTGLINHRSFQEHLERALARSHRSGQPLTLMLCDIDHFKKVNDTYGHPAGDEVLRRVSRAMSGEARSTDGVARYGGEEFAIVMEGTGPEGAMQLAERIRQAVAAQTVATERGALSVTLSAGLATAPTDATERAELIKRADETLYAAKHAGRDQSLHAQNIARNKTGDK